MRRAWSGDHKPVPHTGRDDRFVQPCALLHRSGLRGDNGYAPREKRV